ncbi:hypothetical protein B0H13DRAFT_1877048 [Mycena leptocephala]|nr:hypothetical protein B0H13DRAFT_1877048 [Mycena leptocephala]
MISSRPIEDDVQIPIGEFAERRCRHLSSRVTSRLIPGQIRPNTSEINPTSYKALIRMSSAFISDETAQNFCHPVRICVLGLGFHSGRAPVEYFSYALEAVRNARRIYLETTSCSESMKITRHVDPPIHSWLWGFRHFRAACLVGYSEQMEYFPTGIVFLSGPSVGTSHWEACSLTRHHIARDNL